MPPRKYIRKARKAAVGYAKKRYSTRSGGVRVNQLARDVYKIQRSLNVEHKHIDYQIGQSGQINSQAPTKQTPLVIALNTPLRGTSYNNRVGNQVRVTHMTAKYQFTFHNNTDLTQRQMARARIIFAKNASSIPDITQLLEEDSNGHYTPMSFINTQEYGKFVWLKALDTRCSYTQPTNRYPVSDIYAQTTDPVDPNATLDVELVAKEALNIANFYKRAATKTSIRMKFENGSEDVEQMKPYLVLTSDVIEGGSQPQENFDYITVSANIRMTYVDN